MTTWSQLEAQLDAAVFGRLADDTQASWLRAEVELGPVAVLLDRVERSVRQGVLVSIETAHVVRLSVAEVLAVAGETIPEVGDAFVVNGRVLVQHGEAWKDERMNGRDWLCPVNG